MEITKTQLNYIMAIKRLTGGGVSLTGISSYLGVKKPTASVALKKLEGMGYITKEESHESNEYSLTRRAWIILEELDREKFEFMALFGDYLGMSFEECDSEYQRLCGLFSRDFISRLASIREVGYQRENLPEKPCERLIGAACGRYSLPFRVVQCGESSRSMGDKGFVHPAVLIINDDRQDIILESKKIYYRSKENKSLHGELSGLCYLDRDIRWVPADKERDGTWVIPVKKVLYQRDEHGRLLFGIIKIKAQATTVKMPESVAEITFNFEMIEQIG